MENKIRFIEIFQEPYERGKISGELFKEVLIKSSSSFSLLSSRDLWKSRWRRNRSGTVSSYYVCRTY